MPAVLVVDLQNDFCDECLPCCIGKYQKAFCIPLVRKLLGHARQQGWLVIHILTEHRGEETLPSRLRQMGKRPFCVVGTPGAEPLPGLIQAGEAIVRKRSFSAFQETNLAGLLRDETELIVCGVASNCCVQQTVFDAAERHAKQVTVPYDGTSAGSLESHSFALQTMAHAVAAVVPISTLLSAPPQDWRLLNPSQDDLHRVVSDWYQGKDTQLRQARGDFDPSTLEPHERMLWLLRALE